MLAKIIKVSKALNRNLQDILDSVGEDKVETLHTFTAKFPDEVEVDIKICNGDTPFIDAVLFQDGHEVGCLEPSDKLLGRYIFSQMLKEDYTVIVEIGEGEAITWRDLGKKIEGMTEEAKDDNVTVYVGSNEEWFGVSGPHIHIGDDVIDDGCSYLELRE